MNIEKGEAFVVKKGVKLNPRPLGFGGMFGPLDDVLVEQRTDEDHYDRSYCGCVWRAVEVCGSMIAGEWVGGKPIHVTVMSFNTEEVEVWPVTEAYVDAICKGVSS